MSAAPKSVVKVTIAGDEYPIRSDATPEHTRAVAAYLDRAIKRILASGAVVENHKAAILAALQITDELFAEREAAEKVTGGMKGLSGEIRRMLPPQKRGTAG